MLRRHRHSLRRAVQQAHFTEGEDVLGSGIARGYASCAVPGGWRSSMVTRSKKRRTEESEVTEAQVGAQPIMQCDNAGVELLHKRSRREFLQSELMNQKNGLHSYGVDSHAAGIGKSSEERQDAVNRVQLLEKKGTNDSLAQKTAIKAEEVQSNWKSFSGDGQTPITPALKESRQRSGRTTGLVVSGRFDRNRVLGELKTSIARLYQLRHLELSSEASFADNETLRRAMMAVLDSVGSPDDSAGPEDTPESEANSGTRRPASLRELVLKNLGSLPHDQFFTLLECIKKFNLSQLKRFEYGWDLSPHQTAIVLEQIVSQSPALEELCIAKNRLDGRFVRVQKALKTVLGCHLRVLQFQDCAILGVDHIRTLILNTAHRSALQCVEGIVLLPDVIRRYPSSILRSDDHFSNEKVLECIRTPETLHGSVKPSVGNNENDKQLLDFFRQDAFWLYELLDEMLRYRKRVVGYRPVVRVWHPFSVIEDRGPSGASRFHSGCFIYGEFIERCGVYAWVRCMPEEEVRHFLVRNRLVMTSSLYFEKSDEHCCATLNGNSLGCGLETSESVEVGTPCAGRIQQPICGSTSEDDNDLPKNPVPSSRCTMPSLISQRFTTRYLINSSLGGGSNQGVPLEVSHLRSKTDVCNEGSSVLASSVIACYVQNVEPVEDETRFPGYSSRQHPATGCDIQSGLQSGSPTLLEVGTWVHFNIPYSRDTPEILRIKRDGVGVICGYNRFSEVVNSDKEYEKVTCNLRAETLISKAQASEYKDKEETFNLSRWRLNKYVIFCPFRSVQVETILDSARRYAYVMTKVECGESCNVSFSSLDAGGLEVSVPVTEVTPFRYLKLPSGWGLEPNATFNGRRRNNENKTPLESLREWIVQAETVLIKKDCNSFEDIPTESNTSSVSEEAGIAWGAVTHVRNVVGHPLTFSMLRDIVRVCQTQEVLCISKADKAGENTGISELEEEPSSVRESFSPDTITSKDLSMAITQALVEEKEGPSILHTRKRRTSNRHSSKPGAASSSTVPATPFVVSLRGRSRKGCNASPKSSPQPPPTTFSTATFAISMTECSTGSASESVITDSITPSAARTPGLPMNHQICEMECVSEISPTSKRKTAPTIPLEPLDMEQNDLVSHSVENVFILPQLKRGRKPGRPRGLRPVFSRGSRCDATVKPVQDQARVARGPRRGRVAMASRGRGRGRWSHSLRRPIPTVTEAEAPPKTMSFLESDVRTSEDKPERTMNLSTNTSHPEETRDLGKEKEPEPPFVIKLWGCEVSMEKAHELFQPLSADIIYGQNGIASQVFSSENSENLHGVDKESYKVHDDGHLCDPNCDTDIICERSAEEQRWVQKGITLEQSIYPRERAATYPGVFHERRNDRLGETPECVSRKVCRRWHHPNIKTTEQTLTSSANQYQTGLVQTKSSVLQKKSVSQPPNELGENWDSKVWWCGSSLGEAKDYSRDTRCRQVQDLLKKRDLWVEDIVDRLRLWLLKTVKQDAGNVITLSALFGEAKQDRGFMEQMEAQRVSVDSLGCLASMVAAEPAVFGHSQRIKDPLREEDIDLSGASVTLHQFEELEDFIQKLQQGFSFFSSEGAAQPSSTVAYHYWHPAMYAEAWIKKFRSRMRCTRNSFERWAERQYGVSPFWEAIQFDLRAHERSTHILLGHLLPPPGKYIKKVTSWFPSLCHTYRQWKLSSIAQQEHGTPVTVCAGLEPHRTSRCEAEVIQLSSEQPTKAELIPKALATDGLLCACLGKILSLYSHRFEGDPDLHRLKHFLVKKKLSEMEDDVTAYLHRQRASESPCRDFQRRHSNSHALAYEQGGATRDGRRDGDGFVLGRCLAESVS